jgi:hypothetical protein
MPGAAANAVAGIRSTIATILASTAGDVGDSFISVAIEIDS